MEGIVKFPFRSVIPAFTIDESEIVKMETLAPINPELSFGSLSEPETGLWASAEKYRVENRKTVRTRKIINSNNVQIAAE